VSRILPPDRLHEHPVTLAEPMVARAWRKERRFKEVEPMVGAARIAANSGAGKAGARTLAGS
jgi:hypothetical protein